MAAILLGNPDLYLNPNILNIGNVDGVTIKFTGALLVEDWVSNTQTISIPHINTSNALFIFPKEIRNNVILYGTYGISCTTQTADSLTFVCETVPLEVIYVNIGSIGSTSGGGGGGGTDDHDQLINRTLPDQHPISAITGLQTAINGKVDKIAGKGLSTVDFTDISYVHTDNNYTTVEKNKLANQSGVNTGDQDLSGKVDKIPGKGLSTVDFTDTSYVHTDNNYTTVEKTKLSGIAAGAEVNVQADWNQADNTNDSYIQNKPTIPSITGLQATSEKGQPSGYASLDVSGKVPTSQLPTIGASVTGTDGNVVIISSNLAVDSGLPYALILAGL